jgi:hypothetical protein
LSKQKRTVLSCVLCIQPIPEKTMPEHILLNSLGGRKTVSTVICPNCNNKFGKGPDKDLANSTEFLRNICNLQSGDGGEAPHIKGLESDGEKFDLDPGMRQKVRAKKPMNLELGRKEVSVKIEAYSKSEANKLVRGAAIAIAKHIGHSSSQVIEGINQEILNGWSSSFRPAPPIKQQLQFGVGQSQQAMAKACLVLWATKVSNVEACKDQYNTIRDFINDGSKSLNAHSAIAKIDTREVPSVPEKFGQNPNFIWVGSDALGRVFGYYRLYGAIGWRFLLCNEGGVPARQFCLISNPYNNKHWDLLEEQDVPVGYDWVAEEWNAYPPQFDKVLSKFNVMIEHSQEQSQKKWVGDLIRDAFNKVGCLEGDVLTEKHAAGISDYIARAMTAHVLRVEVPET